MDLTRHLDPDTEKLLSEAAAARGMTPEALALEAVEAWTALDEDTAEDEAALAQYERTGMAIPGEDVLAYLKSLHSDEPLPPPKARKLK